MDALSSLFKDFDMAAFLPEMDTFVGQMTLWCRIFVLACPLLLLGFGLKFFFLPAQTPKGIGFRSYFVTGSVEAWQFAQRFAGMCWMILGGALLIACLIFSLFFGKMELMTMVIATLVCIGIQLLLVIGIQVLINLRTLKFFDKDGNPK